MSAAQRSSSGSRFFSPGPLRLVVALAAMAGATMACESSAVADLDRAETMRPWGLSRAMVGHAGSSYVRIEADRQPLLEAVLDSSRRALFRPAPSRAGAGLSPPRTYASERRAARRLEDRFELGLRGLDDEVRRSKAAGCTNRRRRPPARRHSSRCGGRSGGGDRIHRRPRRRARVASSISPGDYDIATASAPFGDRNDGGRGSNLVVCRVHRWLWPKRHSPRGRGDHQRGG